jgi:hypothetical protein
MGCLWVPNPEDPPQTQQRLFDFWCEAVVDSLETVIHLVKPVEIFVEI